MDCNTIKKEADKSVAEWRKMPDKMRKMREREAENKQAKDAERKAAVKRQKTAQKNVAIAGVVCYNHPLSASKKPRQNDKKGL